MSNNDMSDEYYYRLRDEFAMAALTGHMAYSPDDDADKLEDGDAIARLCYKLADAMLKAREVKRT